MDIIAKFKKVHGLKYDYSHVKFENMKKKVLIECEKHGVFEQRPDHHLEGKGCFKCGKGGRKFDFDYVKSQFIEKHGYKYDYSQSVYVKAQDDIKIICTIHKIHFWQTVADHKRGYGCPLCSGRFPKGDRTRLQILTSMFGGIYSGFSHIDVEESNPNSILSFNCSEHGPQTGKLSDLLKHGCDSH